jgi:hypothetical protein
LSPWFQDRGGYGGEYHAIECIVVDRYDVEPVDDRDDCPETDPLVDCKLCEHEVTPDIERWGPVARDLAGEFGLEDFGLDSDPGSRQLNPLRTISAVTETPLKTEGYLRDNAGAEVIQRNDWQQKHKTIADQALFEWLLHDAMEAHLVFYREYKYFDADDPFIQAVLEESGTSADTCAQNVVETWQWLQELDVPEKLGTRQAGIDTFGGDRADV